MFFWKSLPDIKTRNSRKMTFGLTERINRGTIVYMKIVADTNTFLAVCLYEPERDEIIRLTAGHGLIAPDVLPFEIGNALSAMFKRGKLLPDDLLRIWDAAQQIPVELRSIDICEVLKIRSQFNIHAYDTYFLACAIALRCPIITFDRRMNKVAQNLGIHIIEVTP